MTNEKLILETLANLVERNAQLHEVLAGIANLMDHTVSSLTKEQKDVLQNGIKTLTTASTLLTRQVEPLRSAIRDL